LAPTTTTTAAIVYEYWDYEPCTGVGAYGGAQYTYEGIAGSTPGCISFGGETWSQVGLGGYPGPANLPLFFGTVTTGVSCTSCL